MRLEKLDLSNNQLTELRLDSEMTSLQELKVSGNQLKKLTLPKGLRNLRILRLSGNQLVSLTLPSDITGLKELWVGGDPIEEIDVPRGLDLSGLVLKGFDKADVTVEGVLPPQPEPPKEPIAPIPPVCPNPTPPPAPCDVQFILQSAPSIYGPWRNVSVTIQIADDNICLPNNGQRARFFSFGTRYEQLRFSEKKRFVCEGFSLCFRGVLGRRRQGSCQQSWWSRLRV